MPRSVWVLAALSLAACTGRGGTPPPPSPVARPAPSPQPFRRPASAPVAAAPQPSRLVPGSLHWHTSLAQAQADARTQGKLILVGSTKPECSMCDKFQHETAPQCAGRLNQVAVCYVYDITRPEDARIDRTLRAHLRGEVMMPLVGFVTADLAWVHGFGGSRTAGEFMGDIETAARSKPLRAAAAAPAPDGPAVSFVNEFGEREWSAPADVWPAPEDALGPVPALAAAPPAPAPVPGSTTAELDAIAAAALPAPAPSISPEPAVVAAADIAAPPAAPAGAAGSSEFPAASPPPVVAEMAPEPGPFVAPVAVPVAPRPATDPSMSEQEARETLNQALALIRAGRFDEARDELRRVSRLLPNTPVAREADKGGVAVYNARRIAQASAAERVALAARARRDLTGTVWETLFV